MRTKWDDWKQQWSPGPVGPVFLGLWLRTSCRTSCTQGIWRFRGQGCNLSSRCGLHPSNAGSFFTHCARLGIKPTSLQRQCQLINPLHHSGNSCLTIQTYQSGVCLRTFAPAVSLLRSFAPKFSFSELLPPLVLIFFFFFFFFLSFLGLQPQHMEVPRLGVKSEL